MRNIKTHQDGDMKMILIPFKKSCKDENDVINIINSVFSDISQKKDLTKFCVSKEYKRGIGKAMVDSIILQPNISGVGFDIKNFFNSYK